MKEKLKIGFLLLLFGIYWPAQSSTSSLSEAQKDAKLRHCEQYLEDLLVSPLPASSFSTWDNCVKDRMNSKQMSLRKDLISTTKATPESISCSGQYGTSKGWTVSCSSTVPGVPGIKTVYQSYPEECEALRSASGNSESTGQQ